MSQNKSKKTTKLTITVSQKFYEVLEKVAQIDKLSVEEYVLDQVVVGLDADMQRSIGLLLGFKGTDGYQDQLWDLASEGVA